MQDIESFRERFQSLITKFDKDRAHYLSKGYLEAQLRIDFINPFFKALGWDIENKAQKPPHERDVIVELSPETTGRPDYNFRINGITKFFVETKSPSVALNDVDHILQAKTYAWSTKEVYFVILTDFEEFRLYDASLKPNPRFPNEGLIFSLKYTDYLKNIEKLWELSRERVEQGSLEALLPKDTKSKRLRIPPDKSFLEDLTEWRAELAKDIHKRNPPSPPFAKGGMGGLDVNLLNDVVQKLLDRIIFIRIAEDRKIRPERELWEIVAQWKEEGKRKSIMTHLIDLFHEVNADLNGDIFKPHACESADVDSNILADITESLYFPHSRYRFDAIGVELLGSIYERYLGSTIRVTPQRVKVEEKPEVRKAGGVYYTPKYIVDYIVKNTVGKIIEGKTPRQIEKIKILDPACGSGSFLLGAYQYLIDYHLKYYREHPKEAQTLHLFPYWKISPEELSLPLHEKAKILRNNIFGVDIDPQAVEITMMSLYLKALEGERGVLPKKQHLLPPLSNNIKCGNSLIGYDIFDPPLTLALSHKGRRGSLISPPLTGGDGGEGDFRSRINPFDWNSKTVGFGEIMNPSYSPLEKGQHPPASPLNKGGTKGGFDVVIGNPPYLLLQPQNIAKSELDYYHSKFTVAQYKVDIFHLFIEQGISLLKEHGLISYITPSTFLLNNYTVKLRKLILDNCRIEELVTIPDGVFEAASVDNSIFAFKKENNAISRKKHKVKFIDALWTGKSLNFNRENLISQKLFLDTEGHIFTLNISKDFATLFKRITKISIPLKEIARVNFGMQLRDRKKFTKDVIEAESPTGLSKDYKRCLTGKDIERYSTKYSNLYCYYNKVAKRGGCWDEGIQLAKDKIIVRQIGETPITSYDDEGYNCLNTVFMIKSINSLYSEKYLLGILNSKLMAYIWRSKFFDYKKTFPKIKGTYLGQLPIRTIDFNKPSEKAIHDKLVSLVNRMLELHKKKNSFPPSAERDKIEREIAVTDEKIDEIVYGLYGITGEERKIITGS